MQIINVGVSGEFVSKDSKNAGVQGDSNVTSLHIVFGPEWETYSKRIIWHNAVGEYATSILLYDSVADRVSGANPLVFDSVIPSEALTEPGWCSFFIEGYSEGEPDSAIKTQTEHLEVDVNDDHYTPAEPTPSQAQQLQMMIEGIMVDVTGLTNDALASIQDIQDDISVWEKWDSEKKYVPLNKVTRGGSSYICKWGCKGIDPLDDTNGTYWLLIAAKGDRGERGLQGVPGEKGERGINGIAVAANGLVAFNVDENGYLWCNYTGDERPDYYIGEDGNLYLAV